MTLIGWVVVVAVILVISVVVYKCFFGGSSKPSRGYGYCPNMGVCDGCDMCEED